MPEIKNATQRLAKAIYLFMVATRQFLRSLIKRTSPKLSSIAMGVSRFLKRKRGISIAVILALACFALIQIRALEPGWDIPRIWLSVWIGVSCLLAFILVFGWVLMKVTRIVLINGRNFVKQKPQLASFLVFLAILSLVNVALERINSPRGITSEADNVGGVTSIIESDLLPDLLTPAIEKAAATAYSPPLEMLGLKEDAVAAPAISPQMERHADGHHLPDINLEWSYLFDEVTVEFSLEDPQIIEFLYVDEQHPRDREIFNISYPGLYCYNLYIVEWSADYGLYEGYYSGEVYIDDAQILNVDYDEGDGSWSVTNENEDMFAIAIPKEYVDYDIVLYTPAPDDSERDDDDNYRRDVDNYDANSERNFIPAISVPAASTTQIYELVAFPPNTMKPEAFHFVIEAGFGGNFIVSERGGNFVTEAGSIIESLEPGEVFEFDIVADDIILTRKSDLCDALN